MTVFLTTHYMEEAADADYVIVIDDGLIAAKGTPEQLKEEYSKDRLVLTAAETEALKKALAGREYFVRADRIEVPLTRTLDALPVLDACRGLIDGFEVLKGTMDDAFLAITGKEIRE